MGDGRVRSDSASVLNIMGIISVERNYMELLYPVLLYNQ